MKTVYTVQSYLIRERAFAPAALPALERSIDDTLTLLLYLAYLEPDVLGDGLLEIARVDHLVIREQLDRCACLPIRSTL